jgi:L-alanine-DL-glutamate epimerase-like enolase superfamily enzyme
VREHTNIPVAAGESFRRKEYRPFLEAGAAGTMIVDVTFNGVCEGLAVAGLCDAYETNVAPHNCYGPLATLMGAAFCAVTPNLRIMEIDVDEVSWEQELVNQPPHVRNGELLLPDGPGWGGEVNEEVLREHPPEAAPPR